MDGRNCHVKLKMPAQKNPRLFVYGTLRKQVKHPTHQILARHGSYIGMGVFQGRLYNLGRYPGAVASAEKSDRVIGEVYELERNTQAFEILDDYEGRLFSREPTTIFLDTGETITSWIYLYRGVVEERRRIVSGDYLAYLDQP